MVPIRRALSALTGVVALILSSAPTAWAQPQSAGTTEAAETNAPDTLETVVVTAQKVSQDIEKTPISMSAVSGAQLAAQGQLTMESVMQDLPSVSPLQGPGGTIYYIRGIGIDTGAPLASTFADGIISGVSGGARYNEYNNYDLARIEVLNGPQGTLYGRNTVTGAVNTITNDPTNKYEGNGTIGYGNYNDLEGNGVINIPFSDVLQARAAFSTVRHDGYMTDGQSDEGVSAGRLKVLFTPTDDLTVRVGGDYMTINEHGVGEALYLYEHQNNPWQSPNITIPGEAGGITNYCAILPISGVGAGNTGLVNNTQTLCSLDSYRETIWHTHAQIDDDLHFANLTVLGGHELDQVQSFTEAIGNFPGSQNSHNAQDSIEARIASEANSPIKWVGGVYWQENRLGYPNGDIGPGPTNVIGVATHSLTDQLTRSAFGQVTIPIVERFRITGGARYNSDAESETSYSVPSGIPTQVVPTTEGTVTQTLTPTPSSYLSGKASWTKFTWKAGFEYDLTPHSLLYGNAATGYSAGLLNANNVCSPAYPDPGTTANPGCYTSPTVQNSTTGGTTVGVNETKSFLIIAPNSLISYELGVKNRFLDDRLQLNADVYYMHFSNFQLPAFAADATGASAMVYNQVHGAEGYGLEVQGALLFTEADRVDFSVTLEKTRVGDSANPWSNPSALAGGFQTCTGADSLGIPVPYGCHPAIGANSPLPHAPSVLGNIGYQHTFSLASGATVTAHGDIHVESRSWGVIEEYPDVHQAGYAESNLSLIFKPASEKYQLSAWVRNLEDRAVVAGGSTSSSGKSLAVCTPTTAATTLSCGGTPVFVDLQPPRTYGVTVSARV
jgi:iron complex outermembrane recepter protein